MGKFKDSNSAIFLCSLSNSLKRTVPQLDHLLDLRSRRLPFPSFLHFSKLSLNSTVFNFISCSVFFKPSDFRACSCRQRLSSPWPSPFRPHPRCLETVEISRKHLLYVWRYQFHQCFIILLRASIVVSFDGSDDNCSKYFKSSTTFFCLLKTRGQRLSSHQLWHHHSPSLASAPLSLRCFSPLSGISWKRRYSQRSNLYLSGPPTQMHGRRVDKKTKMLEKLWQEEKKGVALTVAARAAHVLGTLRSPGSSWSWCSAFQPHPWFQRGCFAMMQEPALDELERWRTRCWDDHLPSSKIDEKKMWLLLGGSSCSLLLLYYLNLKNQSI